MSRMHFNSSDASSIPPVTSILCNFSNGFVAPAFAQRTIIYLNLHVCFFSISSLYSLISIIILTPLYNDFLMLIRHQLL